jgi:hypothetical protein
LGIVLSKCVTDEELREMGRAVAERKRDPYTIVDEIISRLGIQR